MSTQDTATDSLWQQDLRYKCNSYQHLQFSRIYIYLLSWNTECCCEFIVWLQRFISNSYKKWEGNVLKNSNPSNNLLFHILSLHSHRGVTYFYYCRVCKKKVCVCTSIWKHVMVSGNRAPNLIEPKLSLNSVLQKSWIFGFAFSERLLRGWATT